MGKRRPAQVSTFSLENCLSEDVASRWWCRHRLYQYFSKRLSCDMCKYMGVLTLLAKVEVLLLVWSYGSSRFGVDWSDNCLSRILSEREVHAAAAPPQSLASWICPPWPHTQLWQSLLWLQDNQSFTRQLETGQAECPDQNWTSGCLQNSTKCECVQTCLHCDRFSSLLFIFEHKF